MHAEREAAAEGLVAADAVDQAGPETVEVIFREIAPAVGAVKADEDGSAGTEEL